MKACAIPLPYCKLEQSHDMQIYLIQCLQNGTQKLEVSWMMEVSIRKWEVKNRQFGDQNYFFPLRYT